MRTITTTYDYTITAPDASAFVFSPNVLTVTVGSSMAVYETVTIVGNGITHSRKCINRVAKFDLSVIFRSKFATDRILTYANASTDPYYTDSFNVVVTVDEYDTNVPFKLRWGALQHDAPAMTTAYNTGIRFPYWPAMPVLFNSEVSHAWKVLYYDATNVTATNAQFVMPPALTDSDLRLDCGTGETVTQTTYFYPVTCPTDGRYLRWVDALGRLWHYMFYPSREQGIATQTAGGSRKRNYPTDYTDSQAGRDVKLSIAKQRTFPCFASVDSSIAHIVGSIIASPEVWWYISGRWVRVNIADTTFAPETGYMSDIEFTVELPADYIQEL